MDTPGRRLILGLLAKSVAKVNAAAEADHHTQKITKKRQSVQKGLIPKKKIKAEWPDQKDYCQSLKTRNTKQRKAVIPTKTKYKEIGHENINKSEQIGDEIKEEVSDIQIEKEAGAFKTNPKHKTCCSPGRKLIFDLLKKSAERISECDNKINFELKIENLQGSKRGSKLKKEYIEENLWETKLETENKSNIFKKEKDVNMICITKDKCSVDQKSFDDDETTVKKGTEKGDANKKQFVSETNPQKMRKARTSGKELRKFTPEEDKILLYEMETFGEKINFSKIAKELNRTYKTISVRIDKLKTGKSWREVRAYTLVEDLFIMDAVLKELGGMTLEKLDLPSFKEWKCIGEQIGRQERHVKYRWEYYLKTWLLQHFSGTLNLDIRRMLANYLADNFDHVDAVDWQAVARASEFAGNTVTSLKYVFYTFLFKHTKEQLSVSGEEVTLKDIADVTNKQFKENKIRKVREKTLTRQKEIIKYFEDYVGKTGIKFKLYLKQKK